MLKAFRILPAFFLFPVLSFAQLRVEHLLCENRKDPVGIDNPVPRFTWQLASNTRNCFQSAYELQVMEGKRTAWTSGKVMSDVNVHVPYAGALLSPVKIYQWKVRVWDRNGRVSPWSAPARFQTGLMQPSNWKAKWIEPGYAEDSVQRPVAYFRKEISIKKKISTATVCITAHGMYEARLNGNRIGDHYLSPGWTSYNKQLPYQEYDVTSLLKDGANALGVMVGNGWYRGYLAWQDTKNVYGKYAGLLLQLMVTYADGSSEVFVSGGDWKASTGSIVYAEIYHGETIDARREQAGWTMAGFHEAGWTPVRVADYPLKNLAASENEPVRKHEKFKPVKIFTTPAGEQVIDFGQNLVGWVQVKARGNAGDSVVLHHAEVLDRNGNFYTENLRAARATAKYILAGKGEEMFEPHFTFYGFRYVRVKNFPGALRPDDLEAVALYSDMAVTGHFSCSDTLLNQLQHNIAWGQRGNFLDVPTDCPQRDERLGWTGDAQVFSRTAAFNFGVNAFFAKWLKDVSADQLPNGAVPFVIPNVLGEGSVASTGWADVATIIPWNMYCLYGDRQLLDNQYASMKAWVGYMQAQSKNDLWNTGFHFGDWLYYRPFDDNDGRSAVTDKYLIAQCFFAHSTDLVRKAAQVLGKTDDEKYYAALLEKIKAAFVKEYMTPNGRLVSGTQTAYVLALQFDMIPEIQRASAAARLVQNVKDYGVHLTTGFLGTPYLCDVLTRYGYTDVAYQLLLRKDYPSWLYPVTRGATTIWERWNGIHPDGNFEPASMNSFNHYAYGAIGDWMYRTLAGIDREEDSPGYKKIVIRPTPGGGLTHAEALLETYYGTIQSAWNKKENSIRLDVTIPANTEAMIRLPGENISDMTESGRALSSVAELPVVKKEGGATWVKAGSGSYHFVIVSLP